MFNLRICCYDSFNCIIINSVLRSWWHWWCAFQVSSIITILLRPDFYLHFFAKILVAFVLHYGSWLAYWFNRFFLALFENSKDIFFSNKTTAFLQAYPALWRQIVLDELDEKFCVVFNLNQSQTQSSAVIYIKLQIKFMFPIWDLGQRFELVIELFATLAWPPDSLSCSYNVYIPPRPADLSGWLL